jgi:hypothetical protein
MSFDKFVGVLSLHPVSVSEMAEINAFFHHVETKVVPEIERRVKDREKAAAEARKLYFFNLK